MKDLEISTILVVVATLWIGKGNCGNYIPCSENMCQNNGQCSVMTPSPSPLDFGPVTSTEADANPTNGAAGIPEFYLKYYYGRNWFTFLGECQLFSPKDGASIASAMDYVDGLEYSTLPAMSVSGFWTNVRVSDNECLVLSVENPVRKELRTVPCNAPSDADSRGFFVGLCQRNVNDSHTQEESKSKQTADDLSYLYTCQCPEGYGYENCTKVNPDDISGVLDPGHTYCQTGRHEPVELNPGSDKKPLIFIDHVLFGRPLKLQGSSYFGCSSGSYAKDSSKYCVAANSLSAVTYWCQGKDYCKFSTYMLLAEEAKWSAYSRKRSTPVTTDGNLFQNSWMYISAARNEDYLQAVQRCSNFGHVLATISTLEDAAKAMDLIANTNDNVKGFWINANTRHYFKRLGILGVSGHTQDSCLMLLNNKHSKRLQLKWESCYEKSENNDTYGVICQLPESQEKFLGNSLHEDPGNLVFPENMDCFQGLLVDPIIEYRYHLGENLNRKDVSCPMHVDYRRGNTCYKKTETEVTWREARMQCWSWGGELAFPIPKSDPECTAKIFNPRKEELWIAGPDDCGDVRCAITFHNPTYFIEGTYDTSNDLCYTNTTVDDSNTVARRGLCALPVAMQSRTHLPPYDTTCPPKSPGDEGWPFPNYSWNEEGISGEVSVQPCPEGQNGLASWQCGVNGEWVGYPDLSSCTKIDTETALDELNQEGSVPSEVIGRLYQNVTKEDTIGAGDIKNIINVLDEALKVQSERLPEADDPTAYADQYSKDSVKLMNDLLERPESWFGLPNNSTSLELTKLQDNLDQVAKSLAQYSMSQGHTYPANTLTMEVRKNLSSSENGELFQQGQDFIQVVPSGSGSGASSKKSVGFYAFNRFGCILNGNFDCSKAYNGSDVLNTAVLGATLFDEKSDTDSDVSVVIQLTNTIQQDNDISITEKRCVYWNPKTNDWSSEGCQLVENNNDPDKTICECNHLTNFGVIMDINGNLDGNVILNSLLTWFTIVGCSLSIIGLIICVYVFTAVRGLRGDRTAIHRNLCICLLLAQVLLLVGLDATKNPVLCGVVAGFLHYLFLASFAWMLVEGAHVYLMLVKVFNTGRSIMIYFYLLGYGAPALIVVLSAIIVEASGTHGYGTDKHCWLDTENGLIWAFGAPMAAVLLINTGMFINALRIAKKSIQKRQSQTEDGPNKVMTLLKGSFSLLCILGLTWILGFTYFAEGSEWLAILFALLNSLQGVFILLFHVVLNEKARHETTKQLRYTLNLVRSYVQKRPLQDTTMATATTGATSSGTRTNDRKISMSTDLQTNNSTSDSNVKYYRGQVTMTVTGGQQLPNMKEEDEHQD